MTNEMIYIIILLVASMLYTYLQDPHTVFLYAIHFAFTCAVLAICLKLRSSEEQSPSETSRFFRKNDSSQATTADLARQVAKIKDGNANGTMAEVFDGVFATVNKIMDQNEVAFTKAIAEKEEAKEQYKSTLQGTFENLEVLQEMFEKMDDEEFPTKHHTLSALAEVLHSISMKALDLQMMAK